MSLLGRNLTLLSLYCGAHTAILPINISRVSSLMLLLCRGKLGGGNRQ